MARLLVPLLLLIALVALLTAWDRPAPRADFVFINRGDVSTLDPAIISWAQDNRIARVISEGLTRNDIFTDNFETMPAAAESWELSQDARTYTFHIREDARWSNGAPLTAHDFRFSWRRSMLPDLAGDYISIYQLIKGGAEFISWRAAALADFARLPRNPDRAPDRAQAADALWQQTLARFDELVRVDALDDHTLRVELLRPTPYFLDLLAFPPTYPVYPPLVSAHESIDPDTGLLKSRPDWTKPPLSITNGPFRLTTWRFKRDMRFEKNPHYWNSASLAIDSISIPSVQDPNASVLAFTTGAVDWLSDVTPAYRAEMWRKKLAYREEHRALYDSLLAQNLDPIEIDRCMPKDPRQNIHVFPAFGTYFYNFNCMDRLADGRPNPLRDPKVRKALALCVDKQAITDNIRGVGEPVAATLVPPGAIAGYASPRGLGRDPILARQLLADAGYPNGDGLPAIELLFNKDAGHDLIAQSVAKDWERELGVHVLLVTKEVKTFRENLKNGNYMVSRASWFGDYGDPTTFLILNRTGDGNNDRKYSNPAYDALLLRADESTDPAQRLAILSEAERMIVEDELPLLPIFQYVALYMFDPHKFTGISSHARMEQQLFLVDVFGDGKGSDQPRFIRPGDPAKGRFKIGEAPAPNGNLP